MALKQLVTLRLNRERPNELAIRDLLQELPALRHLEVYSSEPAPQTAAGITVFTHRELKTLELFRGNFDGEIPHCHFPSLRSLSIEGGGETITTSLPNPLITRLANLLSFTQLRVLRLKDVRSNFTENDLVGVFATIPTLEILFMHVDWKHWPLVQCRSIFDTLENDQLRPEPILPQLLAVFVTVDDVETVELDDDEKVEDEQEECSTSLRAFRDSFIRFAEQRFLIHITVTGPIEGGGSTGMCPLKAARFETKKATIYSRGLDLGECLSGKLWRKACKRGFLR